MGQVAINKNVDYSTDAVGKFDFDTEVFRRKIGGDLERNKLRTTTGSAYTTTPITIVGDTATFRFNFYENANTGGRPVFGVADYINDRGIMVYLYMPVSGVSFIQIFVLSPTGTLNTVNYQQTRFYLGDLGTLDPSISHEVVAKINFVDTQVDEAKIDGVISTPEYYGSTEQTPFTFTNATISFGDAPWLRSIPTANTLSETNFMQLKDSNGFILLHFDFLGDNDTEKLTDKSKLITLQNVSSQFISDPINI